MGNDRERARSIRRVSSFLHHEQDRKLNKRWWQEALIDTLVSGFLGVVVFLLTSQWLSATAAAGAAGAAPLIIAPLVKACLVLSPLANCCVTAPLDVTIKALVCLSLYTVPPSFPVARG